MTARGRPCAPRPDAGQAAAVCAGDTVGHVRGDVLDLILIVLAAAFAVAGYRQGFIIGVLSFAGFIGGVALGAAFAPRISRALATSLNVQAFLAILVVFIAAMAGMLLTSGVGVAVRSRVRGRPATILDSIGGAAVNVVAVLLVAWIIGSFVVNSPFTMIDRQVNNSLVLRTVDRIVPQAGLGGDFSPLRSLLNSGPYTQVFGAIGAESPLAVAKPDASLVSSPGLVFARNSIVKIQGIAPSCSRRLEGSGFLIAPDRVITNAHVVAGVTTGQRVITRSGARFAARVVLYDPRRDVAVLDVPGLDAPTPLQFAGTASVGANAIVVGYPLNGQFSAVPARVGAIEQASGPDIYQTAQVTRAIYPVRAIVKPGNSGGPLLAPDGKVYGMVFAAATAVPDTGYALAAAEISADARKGEGAAAPVSTERCQ
jgi:S1-C subfamily serine protease